MASNSVTSQVWAYRLRSVVQILAKLNRDMNEYLTTTSYTSRIELLEMAIELEAQSPEPDSGGIEVAIRDIWLPVFRSASNLTLALKALMLSYPQEPISDVCLRYLSILESIRANP